MSFVVLYLVPDEYENSLIVETILIVLVWGYIPDYWIEDSIDKLYWQAVKHLSGKKRH